MSVETNNEQLSLLEEVDQDLENLTDDEANGMTFPSLTSSNKSFTYKRTEEEQEMIDALSDSNNDFLTYSQKSESEYTKSDKDLPKILTNINKLYYEKGINQQYKKIFAQLIFDESGYDRNNYVRSKVVGFLQMTKDKFTNNPDIKDRNIAFSQYKKGIRSAENIANDTASQMKEMIAKLTERNIPITFGGLKLYQYSGGYGKLNDVVSDVARNNIKEENKPNDGKRNIHKGLGLPTNKKPTWKQAIAAYDKRAENNIK